jgi:CRISPR type I-E-associated protein CasB/Cse2
MSETKKTPRDRAFQFVAALRRACKDGGKSAALRRGLTDNPRMHVEAYPIIADLGGEIAQPYIALAALYATHPQESPVTNFGETCRRIAQDGKDVPDSFNQRFRRLIASEDVTDVISQLRVWVRFASSKGVGINYENLLADLLNWPWYADDIRVKWARSFWKAGEAAADLQTSVNKAEAP